MVDIGICRFISFYFVLSGVSTVTFQNTISTHFQIQDQVQRKKKNPKPRMIIKETPQARMHSQSSNSPCVESTGGSDETLHSRHVTRQGKRPSPGRHSCRAAKKARQSRKKSTVRLMKVVSVSDRVIVITLQINSQDFVVKWFLDGRNDEVWEKADTERRNGRAIHRANASLVPGLDARQRELVESQEAEINDLLLGLKDSLEGLKLSVGVDEDELDEAVESSRSWYGEVPFVVTRLCQQTLRGISRETDHVWRVDFSMASSDAWSSLDMLVTLFRKTKDKLIDLHAIGFVHGDVKSPNIGLLKSPSGVWDLAFLDTENSRPVDQPVAFPGQSYPSLQAIREGTEWIHTLARARWNKAQGSHSDLKNFGAYHGYALSWFMLPSGFGEDCKYNDYLVAKMFDECRVCERTSRHADLYALGMDMLITLLVPLLRLYDGGRLAEAFRTIDAVVDQCGWADRVLVWSCVAFKWILPVVDPMADSYLGQYMSLTHDTHEIEPQATPKYWMLWQAIEADMPWEDWWCASQHENRAENINAAEFEGEDPPKSAHVACKSADVKQRVSNTLQGTGHLADIKRAVKSMMTDHTASWVVFSLVHEIAICLRPPTQMQRNSPGKQTGGKLGTCR